VPRFYFDVRQGDRLDRDPDGLELPSPEDARIQATLGLSEMAKRAITGNSRARVAIEVRDELNQPVLTAAFVFEVRSHTASSSSGSA
jgi:hypothetical protein